MLSADLGARDRWVMAGLVMLGLFTALAGVLSGRSATDYVLVKDARGAAISWASKIDKTLTEPGLASTRVLDRNLEILDPAKLRGNEGTAQAKAPIGDDGSGLLSGFDQFIVNWATKHAGPSRDDYVSKLDGFAIVGPDRVPLAISGTMTPPRLKDLLSSEEFEGALNSAVRQGTVTVSSDLGSGWANRVAFVPMLQGGKVERVYAFDLNQSAAAAMTKVLLTVVTLTTTLLIVMGFTVPAAIAARRIRERWLAEDQIRYLALHDSLTGLPNRLQFRQHLDRAIARSRRHDQLMAVLCLDLDRFKDVNDTLGHPTGDALLEEVAARLRASVREIDLVGRLGGDEFAVVAEDLDAADGAVRLARRLCTALGELYQVNGHEVSTSASIGIALGPMDGKSAEILMKEADLALYRAKQDGRSTFRFFEPAMDAALQKRRQLENDLRRALRGNNELYLDYQPQFDLESGKLTGYEALVRWLHPADGDVSPSTFLPIAEETGLIAPLGEWVLRTACTYARTWEHDLTLAVNLSPAQFKTQDIEALVKNVLDETGFEPRHLELEITEVTLLQNTDAVMETLKNLDQLGVAIAMDDFGTGYSSLSYLTRFPVKKIKIDRSFIDTLGTSPQTSAIVSSIVGLGQSLHVTITAEGVETEDQAEMLKQWGCNQVQGFYDGRPEPEVPESEEAILSHSLVA
jgi:diguanylate cyclase (GGDEF)-like protein